MKKTIYTILLIILSSTSAVAQERLKGVVVDSVTRSPISAATIKIEGSNDLIITNNEGEFEGVLLPKATKITISHVGYKTTSFSLESPDFNTYLLHPLENIMDEVVVSTGYQLIPKERATGSFSFIDNELLNRRVGGDLLSRMEGVTSSLFFDRRTNSTSDNTANLRLRGLSTIYADNQPLIVLDNFPYEGDLNSINPEDVQDITILKDAAAASIWGAKAANGVIVIKTKSGNPSSRINISFSSNLRYKEKPDLFYSPEFLEPEYYMEIEEHFFSKGLYNSIETGLRREILSPFVERLIDRREEIIDDTELAEFHEAYSKEDIRRDGSEYLLRNAYSQQYTLGVDGGSDIFRFYSSLNFENQPLTNIGDKRTVFNVMHKSTYSPISDLDIHTRLIFNKKRFDNNGIDYRTLGPMMFPYYRLKDDQGNPAVIDQNFSSRYKSEQEKEGLLDWHYRPLDELSYNDKTYHNQGVLLNLGIDYSLFDILNLSLKYQHSRSNDENTTNHHPDSYYIRNLINRYTQPDGTKAFPEGGVLEKSFSQRVGHIFRPQVGVNLEDERYSLNGLLGAEFSENKFYSNGLTRYAFDDQTLTSTPNLDFTERYLTRPFAAAPLPAPSSSMSELVDRFVSYYGSASLEWDKKYVVSGSLRWDASNLFGVNSNQRGVPLWSVGSVWKISDEDFFNIGWLNKLRVRATYGINGNLDKSVTAYPVARYLTDSQHGNKYAQLTGPGNPSLTWEKVKVQNYGVDFSVLNNRLEGSAEVYYRRSKDLFGYSYIDPTVYNNGTAIGSYRINYADMDSRGIDIQLSSLNINTQYFKWRTHLLFNWFENEVTNYLETGVGSVDGYAQGRFSLPIVGKPLDMLYSYPWIGLDPATGDPLVVVDGEKGKEYAKFRQDLGMDDLIYHGLSTPPVFGSFRNTFSYKNFDASVNIQYSFNYSFRRASIDYYNFYESAKAHVDYLDRWKEPGDEEYTQVPSLPDDIDFNRDMIYGYSPLLVERGDNLRLQDVVLGYTLQNMESIPFKTINISVMASNLGFIWRKSNLNIDPDYPRSIYPPAKIISFGLKLTL